MAKRFVFVKDGEWIEPTPQRGHLMGCCDCGLVHRVDFAVNAGGRVVFRARRQRTATTRLRKQMKGRG